MTVLYVDDHARDASTESKWTRVDRTEIRSYVSFHDVIHYTNHFSVVVQYVHHSLHVVSSCSSQRHPYRDTQNPTFEKQIDVEYFFERERNILLEVYDVVDVVRVEDVRKQKLIGMVKFPLSRLVSTAGNIMRMCLINPDGSVNQRTEVFIRGDEVLDNKEYAMVKAKCKNLHKDSFFGFGDDDTTWYEVCKIRPDGSGLPVLTSRVVPKSQNPDYAEEKMSWGQLVGRNPQENVRVQVWRKKGSGKEMIGKVDVSAAQLVRMDGSQETPPTLGLLADGKNRGFITFDRFHLVKELTFLDYIKGGLELRLMVAIDYTASNGHPNDKTSLHYIDPTGASKNAYVEAITTVGSIVSSYTDRPYFPAYGFGAGVRIGNSPLEVSHCFPLTLDNNNPVVAGIDGVLAAYQNCLKQVQLSGPTNFSELISTANVFAQDPYRLDFQHYTVLLIITDGMISDIRETIDAIVTASVAPLSIIVVGVGNADFGQMDIIDANLAPLKSSQGTYACRDIVQFVPFDKVLKSGPTALAAATLSEIPKQVMQFMTMCRVPPIQRVAVDASAMHYYGPVAHPPQQAPSPMSQSHNGFTVANNSATGPDAQVVYATK